MSKSFAPLTSCLLLVALLSGLSLSAQSLVPKSNLPVKDLQGQILPYAWSGGMENPQFSNVDLNLDGIQDVVFFDRADRTFTTFVGKGIAGQVDFAHAPEFQANFDSCACREWALLEDYNCDGLVDVFCGGPFRQNMQIYQQVIYGGDSVGFELAVRPINVMSTNLRPIYNTPTDIPAIVDVDNDGDIDIISTQTGSNFFALHTNMAMENYGRCDTLDFVIGTYCCGHFYEGSQDNNIVVADTVFCKRGDLHGGGSRHVGSTLLVQDLDGNGLPDAMLGDVSYATVNAVYNNGVIGHAFMDSVVYNFPAYDSAIFQILFPGLFALDLNADQVKDLMVAPNASAGAENVDGTMHYLNQGTNDFPDYEFQGRGIFSGESLDNGRVSTPAFLDHNDDGLLDLVIGGLNSTLRVGDSTELVFRLMLLENVGTLQAPEFQLIDDDFLDASNLFPPLQASAPTAADLDNDGDQDLVVGTLEGTLRYFTNASTFGQPGIYVQSSFQLQDDQNQVIDVGKLSAPELYDFDGDLDYDLFIGNEFGRISYYENVGTPQNYSFQFVTDTFGQIKVFDEFNDPFSGAAKPRFFDYDDDGVTELLLGSENGQIMVYETPQNGLNSALSPSGPLFGQDFGNYAAPAMAYLDDRQEPFLLVGSARGGVQLWNNRADTQVTSSLFPRQVRAGIKVYPNPARSTVRLEWPASVGAQGHLRVLSLLGQVVRETAVRGDGVEVSLEGLPAGAYLLLVEGQGEVWTGRLIKE